MNLVCTSCIQAAEDNTWSATVGGEPADLCMMLGNQMDAHDCNGRRPAPCRCAYPHEREVPNTGILAGIRCPKCGSQAPFTIKCEATFLFDDDGWDEQDPTWDDDSDIKCTTCDHTGIVAEFQQNLTARELEGQS